MNKKAAVIIAVLALVAGGGLWAYSSHSAPTSPSSSSISDTSSTQDQSSSIDSDSDALEAEESGFTKAVNQYLSDNSITEQITSETGLHNLHMYLKENQHIDPTVLSGEKNEYFPGYLEWYKAEGWNKDIGPQTDPAPAPAAPGEVGKHADGSITLDSGTTIPPERAKGEYVPVDQVLTHIQLNYGNDALETVTELINKGRASKEGFQVYLAKHTKEEMKTQWIPQFKSTLQSIKEVEADEENFKNNYNPNKIYEDTNGN